MTILTNSDVYVKYVAKVIFQQRVVSLLAIPVTLPNFGDLIILESYHKLQRGCKPRILPT